MLEEMIAEAEAKLAALHETRDRLQNSDSATAFSRSLQERNENMIAEWELRLGELNRALMRQKLMDSSA